MTKPAPNGTRCEAINANGKQCKFTASEDIGRKHFCGNHAKAVKATQLMSQARQRPLTAGQDLLTETEYRRTAGDNSGIAQAKERESALAFLATLRQLQQAGLSDAVLARVALDWKAGIS